MSGVIFEGIAAVLFDLDGTLSDPLVGIGRSVVYRRFLWICTAQWPAPVRGACWAWLSICVWMIPVMS